MTWVDQIVEVTGWRGEPAEYGWDLEEAELGVTLPSDFKELSRRFPAGSFYAYLDLLRAESNPHPYKLLDWHQKNLAMAADPEFQPFTLFDPYGLFQPDGRPGVLRWGMDQGDGEYYWLADREVDPDRWPVLARKDGPGWHRYDMTASEVVYRAIADPEFKPYTLADPSRRAFYLPVGQYVDSAEDFDRLAALDRDT